VKDKLVISAGAAAEMAIEGMTLHVGGFLGCGSPAAIIAALVAAGTKGLSVVSNDAGRWDPSRGLATGLAAMVAGRQFGRMVMSHIGTNAEAQRQLISGETELLLVPQGTLAERIRAAGAGLGGFLTPTGVGTEVEEGKQRIELGGRAYLLELPLPGDLAFIKARRADRAGNLQYSKTARNFNPLMASACAVVVAEVEEIVETGSIDPDQVHTPCILVDYLVLSEGSCDDRI
jgi:acetate CoA/acetoacetate CoA-transferase alpha subunit